MQNIVAQIAQEIRVGVHQVQAAVDLLDGGATVPFIARYRKEATGGLDDIQLRELAFRLDYLRELEDRRETILKSIDEQGKLTAANCAPPCCWPPTKQELEDLYLPFKQRRRTKGQIAREFGIEPLADKLWADPTLDPAAEAAAFTEAARGAGRRQTRRRFLHRARRARRRARHPERALGRRRRAAAEPARMAVGRGPAQEHAGGGQGREHARRGQVSRLLRLRRADRRVPSHRALAVFRGRTLEILDAKLVLPEPEAAPTATGKPAPVVSLAEGRIALHLGWSHQGRAADDLLRKCVAWTWRVKL